MLGHYLGLISRTILITLALGLGGCSDDESSSSRSRSPSSGDPTDTPVQTVEKTGFWLNAVRSSLFPVYTSIAGEWNENCYIGVNDSETDLECTVDVMEGDLFGHPLQLQYNVPPELCAHVLVQVPWYWHHSTGVGPREVTLQYTSEGVVDSCTAVDEAGGPAVDCSLNPEVDVIGTEPVCVYDHSRAGSLELPNCCFGSYNRINRIANADTPGGYDIETLPDQVWNAPEAIGACLGGPILASSNWEYYDKYGYPKSLLHSLGQPGEDNEGINEVIELSANVLEPIINFSYQSNFYTTDGNPHQHTGFVSARVSNQPYAVDPIDDLDGSEFNSGERGVYLSSGRSAYTVICMDEAFEVKHRIRAYVREWNTLAAFNSFVESEGVVYDPDVGGISTGDEGTTCDYTGIGLDSCNDYWDLDNLVEAAGGDYDTSVPDADVRAAFFPGYYFVPE